MTDPAQNIEKPVSEAQVDIPNRIIEKVLYKWIAPARPFKRRNREFYVTVIAIIGVVGLILFFAEGVMPVILLISLVFLFYILNTVEPENIEYQITNLGIKVAGKLNDWQTLYRFWFSKRFDNHLLILQTAFIPGRLEIVYDKKDKEEIKNILEKYIPQEEAPPSNLDRLTNWIGKKLPNSK